MKKIIYLLSILWAFTSCSLDEDPIPQFHTVISPIQEVEIPQEFQLGETYTIKVWYTQPTTCYAFDQIYYDSYLNTRTIAVQNIVYENVNCQDLDYELREASFDFHVVSNGTYIFKFWQGVDNSLEDIYYEVEIPVMD